jgi:integrase
MVNSRENSAARLGKLLRARVGRSRLPRSIQIERNFTGGRIATPKSGKARVVEMSAKLAEVVRAEFVEARDLEATVRVLTDRDGAAMLDSDNFRRNVWAPLLRKLGLRHTFAVLHLQDGRSPVWAKDHLGHSSIQITVDVYEKWIPSDRSSGTGSTRSRRRLRTHPPTKTRVPRRMTIS